MSTPRQIPARLSSCKIGEFLVEHELDLTRLKDEMARALENIKDLTAEVNRLKGVKHGNS